MKLRHVIFAALLVLASGASSQASQLVTPLAVVSASDTARCGVVNAGGTAFEITRVEMLDTSGSVAASMPFAVNLDPGNATSISVSGGDASLIYCRITTTANKRFVRGSLVVSDANGNPIYGVAAE